MATLGVPQNNWHEVAVENSDNLNSESSYESYLLSTAQTLNQKDSQKKPQKVAPITLG